MSAPPRAERLALEVPVVLRPFRWVSLLATVAASGLQAQTLRITSLDTEGPIYMGERYRIGALFEAQGAPFMTRGMFVMREVFEGGSVGERTAGFTTGVGNRPDFTYIVPQLLPCPAPIQINCPASVRNAGSAYRKLLRLELFGYLLNPNNVEIARSETRVIEVIPPPEIVSIEVQFGDFGSLSWNNQPLHSAQRVRVKTSGFRFTEATRPGRGVHVTLAHSADLRRSWDFSMYSRTGSRPCDDSRQIVFDTCDPRVISDNELEFDIRTFALQQLGSIRDVDHIGPHDLIIISRESRVDRPSLEVERMAVRLNAYTFDEPAQDDLILWKGLRVSSSGAAFRVLDPDAYNFYPTDGRQTDIRVEAAMDYRLSRVRSARIWLRARDNRGGEFLQYLNVSLAGRSQFVLNTGGELVERTRSSDFLLPAGEGLVSFTLLFADGAGPATAAPARVFYESRPAVVYFGRTAPPEAEVDVRPQYIEVTQAIQDDGNRVRFVANKPTLARVFVGVGDRAPAESVRVQAWLHGYPADSDTPLTGSPLKRPKQSLRPGAPARPGTHDRGSLTESVNFELPDAWIRAGSITLVAEVDPEGKIPNERRDNNFGGQATFKFFPRPSLAIAYLPLCVQTPASGKKCPKEEIIANSAGFLKSVFPIAPNDVHYFPVLLPVETWVGDPNDPDQRQELLKHLRKVYDTADLSTGGKLVDQLAVWFDSSVPINDKHYGFADWRWNGGSGRVALLRDPASTLGRQTLLAHEVGHNYGLRHPNLGEKGCGSEDELSDWRLGDETIQEVGYDPGATGKPFILRPQEHKDLMSYCDSQYLWISNFHYNKLFDSGFTPQGTFPLVDAGEDSFRARARSLDQLQGVATSYFVLSGSVNRGGTVARLDPVYTITSRTAPDPTSPTGEYCIQLSSTIGPLATHCLGIAFTDPETGAAVNRAHFALRVPAPAGVAKIALLRNGRELAALNARGAAPTVSITAPRPGTAWNGGERMITWNASDRDGDTLTYAVLYSADGSTWYPLALDLSERQRALDVSQIQGGANVRFRVLATDGWHTAEDVVAGVSIVQQPRIAAQPATLALGGTVPGQAIEGRVTLSNPGSGPLSITAIRSNNPAFTIISPSVPTTVMAGRPGELVVRFTAPAVGAQTATITLTSNAQGQPSLAVAVSASGVSESTPTLALSTAELDFGAVGVGLSEASILRVSNLSNAGLTLAWSVSGGGFSLVSGQRQVTLAGGADTPIAVRFAPSSVAEFTGVLTITSNDPSRPRIAAPLNGRGLALNLSGPRPTVNAGGVVDAASFQATIAPGGIGSIFGAGMAAATVIATTVPLPRTLGGVQVLVNDIAAPLFFVSPLQINFQTPFEAGTGELTMVVSRNGVPSDPVAATSKDFAPGIFVNAGTREPIVQRPDGTLVTAQAPARAGEALILYLTGMGSVRNRPPTGAAARANPLAVATENPTVTLGNGSAAVLFAGLAPFFVGLGQINAILPNPLPAGAGATLPLTIQFSSGRSQTVSLPVGR